MRVRLRSWWLAFAFVVVVAGHMYAQAKQPAPVPTPTPPQPVREGAPNPRTDLLWVDTAGNMGLDPQHTVFVPVMQARTAPSSVPKRCRASAKRNAKLGFDTVCFESDVLWRTFSSGGAE